MIRKRRFIAKAGFGLMGFWILSATSSAVDVIATASVEGKGKTLVVKIGEKSVSFAAPEEWQWDHLVRSSDNLKVFVTAQGAKERAVYEFSVADYLAKPPTYFPRKIPLVCDLKDARVMDVFSASRDGARLLITIHYCYASDAEGKSFRWHPYFFDTASGTVTMVEP
jgi:hypothetical protein